MKTYLRMLRMIKPYTVQLVLAVVFMVMFSFMSIFSITMISPFLEALFLKGMDEPAVAVTSEPTDSPLVVRDDAGPPAESDDERRARYDSLKDSFSGLDSLKFKFKDWASENMLQGTKQEALLRICITFFLLTLIKNVSCYIQEILMVYVGQAVIRDLRNELYLKMTSMPMSFFHQHKAGELISRATNDVMVAQQCVGLSFTKLIKDPIFIVMYLGVALILSWKMTLLALVLMPVSLTVIIRIGKKLRQLSYRQQEQMAHLTSTLQETVYGIRVIKAFAMEKFENRKFVAQSQDLFKQVFRINYTMKASSPLTEQISMVVALFLLWFGGSKVFTGGIMAPERCSPAASWRLTCSSCSCS